ncbi:MAG: DUF6515 family protein [Burkholderiales bacterium]
MTRSPLHGGNLVLAGLLALYCATGLTPPAQAEERGSREHESHGNEFRDHESRGHEFREHEFRDHEFREHEFRDQRFLDSRYHHDHYYPPVGYRFGVLPGSPFVAVHGGRRFYFSAGIWYAPYSGGFVVVAPPFGVVIPVLPPYYTQVWAGGIPYYYANNVYYMQSPAGYTVAAPPSASVVEAPPPPASGVTELGPVTAPSNMAPPVAAPGNNAAPAVAQSDTNRLFLYPRQGQSIDQQNKDRTECNTWAAGQASSANAADFQRALGACLDGRGYTVR